MAADPLPPIRISALASLAFQGDAAAGAEARPMPSLRPGAEVTGRIVAQLGDGRVVLDVEGAPFQTRLPQGLPTALGTRLPLVVLEGGDTPTFGLAAPEGPDTAPASARVALSSLSAQLQSFVAEARRDAVPVALVARPLLPAPPADAAALETSLRGALEQSGLFYESHQADWVTGHRPLASLRQEPQARLARSAATEDADAGPRTPDVASGETPARTPEPVGARPDTPHSADPERPEVVSVSLPPGIATLVERQLQSLGTQQIHWSGLVWPGQNMEWDVREEPPDAADPAAPPAWTSRVRLELPRLGAVEAVLRLRGQGLALELRVADGARADVGAGVATLRDSLEARGLSLDGLTLLRAEGG